jgi:hypothetical protein
MSATAVCSSQPSSIVPSTGIDITLEKLSYNSRVIINACVIRCEAYPQNIATHVAEQLAFARQVILNSEGLNLSLPNIFEPLCQASKALSSVICVTSAVAGADVPRLTAAQMKKVLIAIDWAVGAMNSRDLQLAVTPQHAKPFITLHLRGLSAFHEQPIGMPLLYGSPLTFVGKNREETVLRLCQSEAHLMESGPNSLDHHIQVGFKLNTYTCLESQPAVGSIIESYLGVSSFTLFAAKGGVHQHSISLFRTLPSSTALDSRTSDSLLERGLTNLKVLEKNVVVLESWKFPTSIVAQVESDNGTWMMYANAGDVTVSLFPARWELDQTSSECVVIPREDYNFLPIQRIAIHQMVSIIITPPLSPPTSWAASSMMSPEPASGSGKTPANTPVQMGASSPTTPPPSFATPPNTARVHYTPFNSPVAKS